MRRGGCCQTRGHSRSKLHTKFEISQIFVRISRFELEISKLLSEISNKLNTTFLCCNYVNPGSNRQQCMQVSDKQH